MIDTNISKTLGKYAVNKEYEKAVALIQEKDDVVRLLAIAYDNEGYEITAETEELSKFLLNYAKQNFDSSFTAEVAVYISEHKTNIETYFFSSEDASDCSIVNGDNPCIGIYEKLINELYILAISKSNGKDDDEVISDYLKYEGYTLKEYKNLLI